MGIEQGPDYTRSHGSGHGGDRRGLVLDGLGRRPAGRATAPPRLDRCLRHRPLPRHQSRVCAVPRGHGRGPASVVDGSALRRAGTTRRRHELVRGRRVLRLAVGEDRRAAPPSHRGGMGEGGARRTPGRAVSLGRRTDRPRAPSSARRSSPTRQRTRSASPRSRASVTSGVSTGTARTTTRPLPTEIRQALVTALDGSPAAAPGAIVIRGAPWPIARLCPRRCATRTTASEWCARPIRPRSRRQRPQRSHERLSSTRALGPRDTSKPSRSATGRGSGGVIPSPSTIP